jgi:hypothetical protein
LQLLKLHRGAAVEAIGQSAQENIDQAREQLLNKLLRLKRRMEVE